MCSRSAFGQDNFDLSIVDHSTRNEGHDRHTDDIPAIFLIPISRILQRRIPAKSEAVVPASHKRIARFDLKNAVLRGLDVSRSQWAGAQLRGGNITDEVGIVSIPDTSGEVEVQRGEYMRSRALVERLSLVLEAGEVAFQAVAKISE